MTLQIKNWDFGNDGSRENVFLVQGEMSLYEQNITRIQKYNNYLVEGREKKISVFQATTEPQIVRKTSRRQVECWRSFFAGVKMF
jgi:hypothetical protein